MSDKQRAVASYLAHYRVRDRHGRFMFAPYREKIQKLQDHNTWKNTLIKVAINHLEIVTRILKVAIGGEK